MTEKQINQLNHRKKGIRLSLVLSMLEQGKSQKDIAEELGCSEANISKRLKWMEKRKLAVQQYRSFGNIWNPNPDNLTTIIGDEVNAPKEPSNIELHQFDGRFYLTYSKHIEILDKFLSQKYEALKGNKWSPKRNQCIYSIPIYLKQIGCVVTLRKSKGSNSLVIQGVKAWGEDYNQVRDRAVLTCFRVIESLELNLQILFRVDNFEVTRKGDVAFDPPAGSDLKDITKNIIDNLGNVRVGNLQIDDSNKNGGHIEIKTDHKNADKRNQAIQDANSLAYVVRNAGELKELVDFKSYIKPKMDYIIQLMENSQRTKTIEAVRVTETTIPVAVKPGEGK